MTYGTLRFNAAFTRTLHNFHLYYHFNNFIIIIIIIVIIVILNNFKIFIITSI